MGTLIKPTDTSYVIVGYKKEKGKYQEMSSALKQNDYDVKTLDLADLESSDHYNPFESLNYCAESSAERIRKIIDSLIRNTNEKDLRGEPEIETVEKEFLYATAQSMVYLDKEETVTFGKMLRLMREELIGQNGSVILANNEKSMLESKFEVLKNEMPHLECIQHYDAFKASQLDLQRQALIIALIRMTAFGVPAISRITNDNAIDWGYSGREEKEKIAIFVIVNEKDASFNFLTQMLLEDVLTNTRGRKFQIVLDEISEDFIRLPEEKKKNCVKNIDITI